MAGSFGFGKDRYDIFLTWGHTGKPKAVRMTRRTSRQSLMAAFSTHSTVLCFMHHLSTPDDFTDKHIAIFQSVLDILWRAHMQIHRRVEFQRRADFEGLFNRPACVIHHDQQIHVRFRRRLLRRRASRTG